MSMYWKEFRFIKNALSKILHTEFNEYYEISDVCRIYATWIYPYLSKNKFDGCRIKKDLKVLIDYYNKLK